MLMNGKKLSGPSERFLVFPRAAGDVVFKVTAVLDYDDFEKLCPYPEAPWGLRPGGIKFQDVENPEYKENLSKWCTAKTYWMILKSLSSVVSLEWETVKWADTESWGNYRQELLDSGLTQMEVAKLQQTVFEVNGLDETKINEATDRFLLTLQKGQSATPTTQSTGL